MLFRSFAVRVDNLPIPSPWTKEMITEELRNSKTKHTEHIFTTLLCKNRKVYDYDFKNLINQLGKLDMVDSHESRSLNWVIPVYNQQFNCLELFMYNEHGGEYSIGVSVNGKIQNYQCPNDFNWMRTGLCSLELPLNLQIYINGTIAKTVILTEDNIESFKNKNKITFKQHD